MSEHTVPEKQSQFPRIEPTRWTWNPHRVPVLRSRTGLVGPGPQTRKNRVWEPDPPSGVILEPVPQVVGRTGPTQELSAGAG